MQKRHYAEASDDSGEDILKRMKESMGDPELFKAVLEQSLPCDVDPRIVALLASMSQYVPKPIKKVCLPQARYVMYVFECSLISKRDLPATFSSGNVDSNKSQLA